jgi:hypothetical protein
MKNILKDSPNQIDGITVSSMELNGDVVSACQAADVVYRTKGFDFYSDKFVRVQIFSKN